MTLLTATDQLTSALRRRIVSGDYSPGHRLPTYQDIEDSFSVSRGVAQMAIERLKKDGFVNSTSRQGLFVASNPPHLRRYGIVFPVAHGSDKWSIFDEVMVREARKLQDTVTAKEFRIFAGIGSQHEGGEVLEQLRQEVINDQLAGLILFPGCDRLVKEAPFDDPALPKVFVFRYPDDRLGPVVTGDGDSIIDRSLQHLADEGCRRVAAIRIDGAYSSMGQTHFERHGLPFRKPWLQVVGRGDAAVLSTLIPLLLDYPEAERPDGLFIMDDGFVDHVIAALVAMGIRIGEELKLVTHCNWPASSPSLFPMRRIGFDVGHMLQCCLHAIDMQRQGKLPPDVQRVPAMFEDEIQGS